MATESATANSSGPAPRRGRRKKSVTCADCYFMQNDLCALGFASPCPTFRAGGTDGLKPPRQLSLMPAAERRPRTLLRFRSPLDDDGPPPEVPRISESVEGGESVGSVEDGGPGPFQRWAASRERAELES